MRKRRTPRPEPIYRDGGIGRLIQVNRCGPPRAIGHAGFRNERVGRLRSRPDSVREQGWDSDRLEHAARHSAQNEFPKPGMAVAAHHDQIAAAVGSQRQDGIVNV